VAIYLLYPPFAILFFSVFRCRDISGSHLLVSDLSIDCYLDEYAKLRGFSIFMVVLWGIGVPVICVLWLAQHKQTLANLSETTGPLSRALEVTGPLRTLDFLFVHYRPRLWYFEILQFAKKLFLICICPAVIGEDNIASALVAVMLLVIWLFFTSRVQPYMSNSDQMLAHSLDFALILMLLFSIVLKAQGASRSDLPLGTTAGPMIGTILAVFVATAVAFCSSLKFEEGLVGFTRSVEKEQRRQLTSSGIYDVLFDDGRRDNAVAKASTKSGGGNVDTYKMGDKVEAQFEGKGKHYPGKIHKVNDQASAADEMTLRELAKTLPAPLDPAAFGLCVGATAMQVTRALVLGRLQAVRRQFPDAPDPDLQAALLTYSPESALFARGHKSQVAPSSESWTKYQGELFYGDYQAFHDGSKAVLGADIPDGAALPSIVCELMRQGGANDKYNLWYLLFCEAVEQPEYNKRGELKVGEKANVFDEGHGKWRLGDFTAATNKKLLETGSQNRVTDAGVLGLRLYSVSTFSAMNTALRSTGTALHNKAHSGSPVPELKFRACIQSARKCLLEMAALPREATNTYRGVTGYLADEFEHSRMGMDFAFASATTDRKVAEVFIGSAEKRILFELLYASACPGVDISMLSVYPGQKEVLFPPCTGLCLTKVGGGVQVGGGQQGLVRVIPFAAR
jgi:hypothetical protein